MLRLLLLLPLCLVEAAPQVRLPGSRLDHLRAERPGHGNLIGVIRRPYRTDDLVVGPPRIGSVSAVPLPEINISGHRVPARFSNEQSASCIPRSRRSSDPCCDHVKAEIASKGTDGGGLSNNRLGDPR